jgi:dTMP kinase
MKIIAIEGLDKSGKHTQTKMLAAYLEATGYKVMQSEFHRYDTPTGQLIMDWLTGKWDVDQYTIELIMTADKQAQQKTFDELEKQGVDFLILDRYTSSQQVYSKANDVAWDWTIELQRYMRYPDFEIFIDIPAEESMVRKGKHNNGENDRYESDLEMLNRVRDLFLHLAKERPSLVRVNGMQSVQDVYETVVELVDDYIFRS